MKKRYILVIIAIIFALFSGYVLYNEEFVIYIHKEYNYEKQINNISNMSFTATKVVYCCNNKSWKGHLQGIATDGSYFYWSFTNNIVKTYINGTEINNVSVDGHVGDITYYNKTIYGVHSDIITEPTLSHIYEFRSSNLSFIRSHDFQSDHILGAIDYLNEEFYVGDSSLSTIPTKTYVFNASNWTNIRNYTIAPGNGIFDGAQSLGYWNGTWWIGTYDSRGMFRVGDNFNIFDVYAWPNGAYGIKKWNDTTIITGVHQDHNKGYIQYWNIASH